MAGSEDVESVQDRHGHAVRVGDTVAAATGQRNVLYGTVRWIRKSVHKWDHRIRVGITDETGNSTWVECYSVSKNFNLRGFLHGH